MNPPWAGDTPNICEGRGATHQPSNTCTALRQDKCLYLTHLSSGQMSEKSLLSFFLLNRQYTKTPSFSQECWKSCSYQGKGLLLPVWDFPISPFIFCRTLEVNKAHWQWDGKCSLGLSTLQCFSSIEFPLISACNLP